MVAVRRTLALLVCVLLTLPLGLAAHAVPPKSGWCLHADVSVSAGGELLSKGAQIAGDGGFAHAGTGQTFIFQARTFTPTQDICVIRLTDPRSWQVSLWPCENVP